ncbi:hypothetical protein AJ80_09988 [Polytolypa hystricis UAMH7299]|uniref:Uncharacterized protein n=1 Tax=Polytolypa hystricis (strain UAMH7299) TaxID=1447883 RepID=A0A2B7WFD6_POLH7|nr:hypothetical protein AJ80_09988 [Polytolypa hystricis UAMH7299]
MNLQSIFSLLVLHSSLAARAAATSANDDNNDVSDEKVGTGCCPPDDPAFQRAMQHPNATGTFTFPGLPLANVSGNNRQQKSSPSVNWTLSTSVMEVSLSSSSSDNDHGKSATNQIFTLDIPLDVPLYSADVQQNVCLVLLDFVGQNRNDPGNCENVFVRSKVEGLRDRLVKAVADTAAKGDGDRSPCSVLGGLWQGKGQGR